MAKQCKNKQRTKWSTIKEETNDTNSRVHQSKNKQTKAEIQTPKREMKMTQYSVSNLN